MGDSGSNIGCRGGSRTAPTPQSSGRTAISCLENRTNGYNPTGFVRSANNAEWGMQFIWPFKAEFLVVYLEEDYSITVIGRTRRDYVWIMAREPQIEEEKYQEILAFLAENGYDTGQIQKVPQQWPES